jgi:hypothetical protein
LSPMFVLESVAFGESWVACGLLGGLYNLAAAHVYLRIPMNSVSLVTNLASAPLAGVSEPDIDLRKAGSGWSRPFE